MSIPSLATSCPLNDFVRQRRVIVCIGTGGVGKTSVSAALGITAVELGMRALVMTIDPAKRLAHALGIRGTGIQTVEVATLNQAGFQAKTPLDVMVLDVKSTFDDLVSRFSREPNALLNNRIYHYFSTQLAGAHEYAAVEKFYEMHASGRYDLIILDTPPSQNAVDFFEAPTRTAEFFDSEILQWLRKSQGFAGKFPLRLFDIGSSVVSKTLGKMAGVDTLRELADFLLAFQGMYEGFAKRANAVELLLRDAQTAFLVITAPTARQQESMLRFREELASHGFEIASVVVNRMHQDLPPMLDMARVEADIDQLLGEFDGAVRNQLKDAAREELALALRDKAQVLRLQAQLPKTPIWTLPELNTDVHDLPSLAVFCQAIKAA